MRPDTLSVAEVADRIGYCVETVRAMLDDDRLPLDVIRLAGKWRIPSAQVEFYCANGRRHESVAELAEFIRITNGIPA